MNEYLVCWKKYAVFDGRATRREYWMFSLINFMIYFGLLLPSLFAAGQAAVNNLTPPHSGPAYILGWIGNVYGFAQILPGISVAVRRFHDTDHSGWWYWINLIPIAGWIVALVFLCSLGTEDENRYGPVPDAVATG